VFDKVLIANRGEIACRIIRACAEEGLASVAVYSDADRHSPHVLMADESVRIGPAPAAESYLDADRLIEAASLSGAGAVHPGYGFLAENAGFARAVEAAGLTWVGPPPDAIEAMGDKTRARDRMIAAGVPVVPGSPCVRDTGDAIRAAGTIGYPVMLKAAAGGGGKGMRVARDDDELASGLERATREASQAFGDSRVYLERYLQRPRHIEIQVMADHERAFHLGERECSIQRRHQKLIEEAPSPALEPETRARMGDVAVRAATAVGYVGAGTVEFLYEAGEFFFLEMNTRIQVEHPVTELVTGVDLVRDQLRIAGGLTAMSGPREPRGHAIECRINAEDPARGFLPSSGLITAVELPGGPGIRWDGGVRAGYEVGLHYDPLIGKLIAHADTRTAAITRMRVALRQLRIEGVRTTVEFHLFVMHEPDFLKGDLSIRYVDEHPFVPADPDPDLRDAVLAAAVLFEEHPGARPVPAPPRASPRGADRALSAWIRTLRDE